MYSSSCPSLILSNSSTILPNFPIMLLAVLSDVPLFCCDPNNRKFIFDPTVSLSRWCTPDGLFDANQPTSPAFFRSWIGQSLCCFDCFCTIIAMSRIAFLNLPFIYSHGASLATRARPCAFNKTSRAPKMITHCNKSLGCVVQLAVVPDCTKNEGLRTCRTGLHWTNIQAAVTGYLKAPIWTCNNTVTTPSRSYRLKL